MLLQDRVAIITGGASGLGEAACVLFAKEGAKVVIADFNIDAAHMLAEKITDNNGEALAVQVDVSDRESIDNMVQTVIDTYGQIDILINNAGITADKTLVKMERKHWDQVIAVNLTGVFDCGQAVAPHMIEKGYGRIINTSSIVGKMGNVGQSNYSAAKAGVIGLTQTWAKELGRKGITSNAVAPGFIDTPMTKKMPPEVLENMKNMVSVKRLGTPEDIANTYLFLASDKANYINGAVISVDGGLSI